MTPQPPRRVAVVGAGAAGAFFTLELSRLLPEVAVDLYDREERSPGAGIVMSWEFAEKVRAAHPEAFALPPAAMATWDRTLTVAGDERIWSGAYGMFGLTRRVFRRHVAELAAGLPNVRFLRHDVLSRPAGADLVVVADGANSRLRGRYGGPFGTRGTPGRTVFLWMRTPAVLLPTFVLRSSGPGLLIVHSYPHGEQESTFIVEAHPRTLDALGLLDRPLPDVERELAAVFADELAGAPLHSQTWGWRAFPTVVNDRWHHGNLVLIGDAAHTTHFSIGSGTALAIDDALTLARCLATHPSVGTALPAYESTRRPIVTATQAEAQDSQQWFETLSLRPRLNGHQTVFALRSRRTANTYARLESHDPAFTMATLRTLAGHPTTDSPSDLPLVLGGLHLTGRTATTTPLPTAQAASLPATPAPPVLSPTSQVPSPAPTRRDVVRRVRRRRTADAVVLPTATGGAWCMVADGPPGETTAVPPCVLVEVNDHTDPGELVRAYRSAGACAVGLLISEDAPLKETHGADLLAVPAQPGTGRIARTRLADRLRYDHEIPVLLLTPDELSHDEADTLIAAGRIDLVATIDPQDIARLPTPTAH
ncbi:FAD-dependent monooxygenase [Sphaerisporangium sp. B11E5]|uniref:FAD-dependent monooxygenase n=1 Tax=Sphaerisporangium sp. B11E5 TaxID=3153563 RepID=UPI00325E20F7